MRVLYLLRSGDYMPIQLSLPPTSIRPFNDFINQAFLLRRRGVCSAVVQIGLKKANNGVQDYSVATFKSSTTSRERNSSRSGPTPTSSGSRPRKC
nr:hypothetical protein [uncultured Oscillibacter sp.]